MRGGVHKFDLHVEEVDLFEQVLNILVLDVQVGVESHPSRGVAEGVLLGYPV